MNKNMSGKVKELFISIKNKDRKPQSELELKLDGIVGDKFYAKGITRSVLIASIDSYNIAREKDIDIAYGFLGENILLDINPYSLNEGDSLYIGDVILEITQNCTICNSLAKVDASLPTLLKNDRGIFAKTVKAGNIKKGDIVKVIQY